MRSSPLNIHKEFSHEKRPPELDGQRTSGQSEQCGRDVTKDRAVSTHKDDAVSRRISRVPFHFCSWDSYAGALCDVGLASDLRSLTSDDRHKVLSVLLEEISFVSVCLSTTRDEGVVRAHKALKPLAHMRWAFLPFLVVAN